MTAEAAGVPSPTQDADAALEQLYDAHYVRLVRLAVLLLRDRGVPRRSCRTPSWRSTGRW